MSYEQNKPSISYYVNLATYTTGYFGNTNFNPPLSDPIPKTIVSYTMNNYDSFYYSLEHGSMTVMNITWDILSDVLVAMIGFFVFGETLTLTQCFGLLLAFVGIALLGAH